MVQKMTQKESLRDRSVSNSSADVADVIPPVDQEEKKQDKEIGLS